MNADDLEAYKLVKTLHRRNSLKMRGILNLPFGLRTKEHGDELCSLHEANKYFEKGLDLLWPNWRTEE